MVGVPTNTFAMDENNPGLNPEAGLNPRRKHGGADQRVKAAAAKPVSGEGVEPTYNMTDMIEFATRWQEERDTTHAPIQIKGGAAKIKFND